jgi:hypothetical protein
MLIAVCWRCESSVLAYSMMVSLPLCIVRSGVPHHSLTLHHGGILLIPFALDTTFHPSHKPTHIGTVDILRNNVSSIMTLYHKLHVLPVHVPKR